MILNDFDSHIGGKPDHRLVRTANQIQFISPPINLELADSLCQESTAITNGHDAILDIVGEGPEHDRLESIHDTLNHENRVTFIGFLDDYEDLLGHMRSATVFASPSTREGFGLTFAEAMAADCTVIAAEHPDSAANEVVGDAGYLVDPTPEALAETMARALDGERPAVDPKTRAKQFDWDRVADQAATAYKRASDGTW